MPEAVRAARAGLALAWSFVAVLAGQTWDFQAWYRDPDPQPTTNLTSAVELTFE